MLRRTFVKLSTAAVLATATSTASFAAGHSADIVDTAVAAGSFTTLVAAVQAAGLVDTLKGEGPFTVFAPTDEAFAALPEGTVENLLKPENIDMLTAILTYHVVSGPVMASDIAGQEMMVPTVQGGSLNINATNGVMINGATVIQADIEAQRVPVTETADRLEMNPDWSPDGSLIACDTRGEGVILLIPVETERDYPPES